MGEEKREAKVGGAKGGADALEIVKALIKDRVAAQDLDAESQKMQIEALTEVIIEGKTPAEAMKLPEEFIKLLYKKAYDLYNLGLYQEANGVFRFLCMLEPGSPRYHLGLAATLHQTGKYEHAAAIYYVSYLLDPRTPLPLYYISNCCEKMQQPGADYMFLKMTADACGTKKDYERLKNRCYLMMDALIQQNKHIFNQEEKTEGVKEGEVDIFAQLKDEAKKGIK